MPYDTGASPFPLLVITSPPYRPTHLAHCHLFFNNRWHLLQDVSLLRALTKLPSLLSVLYGVWRLPYGIWTICHLPLSSNKLEMSKGHWAVFYLLVYPELDRDAEDDSREIYVQLNQVVFIQYGLWINIILKNSLALQFSNLLLQGISRHHFGHLSPNVFSTVK